MQPTHGCGTLRSASSSSPTQSEKAQLAPTPSLQPYAAEAATVCGRGCNRMRQRLQPSAAEAATVRGRGCNRKHGWHGSSAALRGAARQPGPQWFQPPEAVASCGGLGLWLGLWLGLGLKLELWLKLGLMLCLGARVGVGVGVGVSVGVQ